MWPNFDGKPYARAELAAHIAACDFAGWKHKDGFRGPPDFITVHNTSIPDIKAWLAWPPEKRQQYIRNMQPYYEGMGWRGGPHFFVPPQGDICAFGFNDLMAAGTHASCFNNASIGIEMVGEFNDEAFDSGPGALVRDNAVFLLAALHLKIGIRPDGYEYGKSGLHFHVECKHDNHDCPGKNVHKDALVAAVLAEMERRRGAQGVAGAAVGALPAAVTAEAPPPAKTAALMAAGPPKAPSYAGIAYRSRTVNAIAVFVATVTGWLGAAFSWLSDHLSGLFDLAPAVADQVRTNLRLGEELAGWFGANWKGIETTVAVVSLIVAIALLLHDKRNAALASRG